ncbi:hypothetical protein J3D54_001364 [Pseudomonas sp. GGS8]|nr:hypothetical protein [Pseudomonas sp. GGS8]
MNGFQQGFGRSCRFAAALLPVAQRAELNVDQCCELGLSQTGSLADFFDV